MQAADAEDMRVRVGIQSEHTFAGNVWQTAPPRRRKVIHFECCDGQLALTTTYAHNETKSAEQLGEKHVHISMVKTVVQSMAPCSYDSETSH